MRQLAAMLVALCGLAAPSAALTCSEITHEGSRYTLCEVDPRTQTISLFLRDAEGEVFGQFLAIDAALREQGQRLAFGMNAGMYHDDRSPVGHYVENGQEQMRIITSAGPGNFGLLPNGILCLRQGRADVFETLRFIEEQPDCLHATQSGPMLVFDGMLHPRFLADGTSRFIRNGVGTSADGTRAIFAISEDPVNFYNFGTLFRDRLQMPNALYFDGKVSRLYAPDLGRNDFGFALGPIIGVVTPLSQ